MIPVELLALIESAPLQVTPVPAADGAVLYWCVGQRVCNSTGTYVPNCRQTTGRTLEEALRNYQEERFLYSLAPDGGLVENPPDPRMPHR